MATIDEIRDEQTRMLKLQRLVDQTCYRLRFEDVTLGEAFELMDEARERILELFPGSGDTFELIVRPRFVRMISDRALEEWNEVSG